MLIPSYVTFVRIEDMVALFLEIFLLLVLPFFFLVKGDDEIHSEPTGTTVSFLSFIGCVALGLVTLGGFEQIYLWKKKANYPGPRVSVPFIGSTLQLLYHPYEFWKKQEAFAKMAGISWNYFFGKFVLLFVKAKYARIPFVKNSVTEFLSFIHPNATAVFGEGSVLFMSGPKHQELRRSFLKLFTRKAVSVYLIIQHKVAQECIQKWLQQKEGKDIRENLRDFNARSSQAVLVGPYIHDTEEFQQLMCTMGKAFGSIPINFPGGGIWKTNRARKKVEDILTAAVKCSKEKMIAGDDPSCFLDFWSQIVLADVQKAEQNGKPPPDHADDFQMASTVLDFLFAAQDASTSSLAQTVALMSDYPEVLAKVRMEQERVNPNNDPITYEKLLEMTYTRQVIKEVLRFRPPVPMWAHIPTKDMKVDDDFIAPKNSVVFSSISAACREGFTNPNEFDPDRMGPERQEDVKHSANFLVFGAGPHQCAGRMYAMNHMMVFLSVLCANCTWKRRRTERSDELEYLPSAYPADLLITFQARQ